MTLKKEGKQGGIALSHDEKALLRTMMVDVPRFELGNSNAERIRCFIIGFQLAERYYQFQQHRYGGGL